MSLPTPTVDRGHCYVQSTKVSAYIDIFHLLVPPKISSIDIHSTPDLRNLSLISKLSLLSASSIKISSLAVAMEAKIIISYEEYERLITISQKYEALIQQHTGKQFCYKLIINVISLCSTIFHTQDKYFIC